MFSSIVVPVDLAGVGSRALPIAKRLAELGGLPIELLTVVSREVENGDHRRQLDACVRSLAAGPHTSFVVESEHAGDAIAEHVRSRHGAMLVMATTARGAMDEDQTASVSRHVLAEARQPVLLVGPNVEVARRLSSPTLVAAVDGSGLASVAVPVVVSWWRTFGGAQPRFVEVIPHVPAIAARAGRALEAVHVRAYVDEVARSGVAAAGEVVYGDDVATALAGYVEQLPDSVLVVTAERWSGAPTHWHGTSRKLVRRSSSPVLVVPADLQQTQRSSG